MGRRLRRLTTEHSLHLLSNPWIEYFNDGRRKWCQPDFILTGNSDVASYSDGGAVLVVEVKLTQTEAALEKYHRLYKPCVEMALGCKTCFLLVCRNLHYEPLCEVTSPLDAFALPASTWHYAALHEA